MMNYYEEFGIPRDAPEAVIRQAYKRLARVLHPDAHPDEALKAVAERQMTRLNAMLDTLLDPAQRRAYDAGIFEATHRRRLPPAEVGRGNSEAHRYLRLCFRLQVMKQRAVLAAGTRRAGLRPGLMRSAPRHWFWILTGLMMAGTGVWYVAAKDSAVVNRAAAETASQAESPRAGSGGAGPETWAGNWVYASRPEDAVDAGPTAPSYSELLLAEEHGKLTGIYRARYRIGDQALPPEVAFRVEGTVPSGHSARLVWASAGGAKGEAELILASSDVIKVAWWTTALGPAAALTSGTATLVRQRVR